MADTIQVTESRLRELEADQRKLRSVLEWLRKYEHSTTVLALLEQLEAHEKQAKGKKA